MPETVVLRIEPDGTVVGLSGSGLEEVLDLRTFGKVVVEKAGSIYFDADGQTWGWMRKVGDGWVPGNGGFKTRREAVADEVATMARLL